MQAAKPIKNNVLLYKLEGEEVTSSGIILARAPDPKAPPKAVVMAIGPLVEEVAEGDEVIYNQHAAKPIEIEGQEYLVVNVHDVIAKLTKSDDRGDKGHES